MTAPSRVVRETARVSMKGHILKCLWVGCMLLFPTLVVSLLCSTVLYLSVSEYASYVAMALLTVFLLMPLYLGAIRFFHRLAWGRDDSAILVFSCFSSAAAYRRALRLCLLMVGKLLLNGLVLFLPAIVTDLFSGSMLYEFFGISMPDWTSNLWVLAIFFRIVAALALMFVMLRYYMAPYLYIADEEMTAAEAMHMSTVIAKRTSFDFLFLVVSMLGWILLSFFVLPLPLTVPYFFSTYVVHCRFAVTQYNRAVDKLGSDVPYYSAEG